MANGEIKVVPEKIRESASKMKDLVNDLPYDRDKVYNRLHNNGGDAYNALFEVDSKTDMLRNCTKQLVECTARFLSKSADTFESEDNMLAKELKNK